MQITQPPPCSLCRSEIPSEPFQRVRHAGITLPYSKHSQRACASRTTAQFLHKKGTAQSFYTLCCTSCEGKRRAVILIYLNGRQNTDKLSCDDRSDRLARQAAGRSGMQMHWARTESPGRMHVGDRKPLRPCRSADGHSGSFRYTAAHPACRMRRSA